MQISIQNNQENSYEKIKKFLNNPITKFSLGTVGGITSIGALSLIVKLVYDKIYENIIYNEIKIDNDVTLSIADQIWIAKNMILFAQKTPLCWHNVFMQLLACPEYIYYSNLPNHPIRKSKKIMTMINFAKKNLPGIFSEGKVKIPKVTVPMEVRQMPDSIFSKEEDDDDDEPNEGWLKDNEDHRFVLYPASIYNEKYLFDNIQFKELGILDTPVTEYCGSDEIYRWEDNKPLRVEKPINEVSEARVLEARQTGEINETYGWHDYTTKDDAMKYYNKKSENILNNYGTVYKNCSSFKDINCCQEYGYYPTFVVIYDKVDYKSHPHYHCCYIVYDKDKNIKYFLWGDGVKDSFRVMSADKSLERLNKYSCIWVKYSRSDIVEKFYTPEINKNIN